jgi:hypothetical protein
VAVFIDTVNFQRKFRDGFWVLFAVLTMEKIINDQNALVSEQLLGGFRHALGLRNFPVPLDQRFELVVLREWGRVRQDGPGSLKVLWGW